MTTPTRPRTAPKKRAGTTGSATKSKKAEVDPRLKARRVEVARDEGRRRLRTLLGLVVITILAIGSLALIDSSAFDVDRVVVNGVVQTDPATVVAVTGIVPGDPLLEVDLGLAARQVETLPWVASAVVERKWNGDVRVEVVERTPVAALPMAGASEFVLIDASGRQLAVVDGVPSNFLPIEGIVASGILGEPAPSLARSAVRVVDGLESGLRPQVGGVRIEADAASAAQIIVIDLVERGTVILGDDSSLDAKLLSLETMLARADLRCLDTIDLRVPTAPALTRISIEGQRVVADLATCSSTSTPG